MLRAYSNWPAGSPVVSRGERDSGVGCPLFLGAAHLVSDCKHLLRVKVTLQGGLELQQFECLLKKESAAKKEEMSADHHFLEGVGNAPNDLCPFAKVGNWSKCKWHSL